MYQPSLDAAISGISARVRDIDHKRTTLSVAPLEPMADVDRVGLCLSMGPKSGTEGGQRIVGLGFDVQIKPHVTFDSALESLRKNDGRIEVVNAEGRKELRTVDVLLVPGGIGTRMFRVGKPGTRLEGKRWNNVESCVEFASEVCVSGWVRSAVLTVCTGSDLLARTGVLNGRRATTNVAAFEKVEGMMRTSSTRTGGGPPEPKKTR